MLQFTNLRSMENESSRGVREASADEVIGLKPEYRPAHWQINCLCLSNALRNRCCAHPIYVGSVYAHALSTSDQWTGLSPVR